MKGQTVTSRPRNLLLLVAVPAMMAVQALGQSTFQNLDFEAASVPFVPAGQLGNPVATSEGLPGWHAYYGTDETSSIGHNFTSIGSVNVAIDGPDYFPSYIIQGQYTPILQAGQGNGFIRMSAAIAQTGQVPGSANSLIFKTSTFPYPAQLEVTLSLQPLTLILLETNPNYLVFGVDVSAFANQNAELRFAALSQQPLPFFSVSIDDISFSPQSVPEPGMFGLFGLGSLLLGCRFLKRRI